MKLLITIALILMSLAFISFTKTTEIEPTQELIKEVPVNIDYYLTDTHQQNFKPNGTLDFTLASKDIKHFEKEDESTLTQPFAQFKRNSDWSIQAQLGQFFHRPEIVYFLHNARIYKQSPNNYYKIRSDTLELKIKHDIVISTMPVTVTGKKFHLSAQSMRLNLDTEKHLFHSVKARYQNDKPS